MVGAGFVFGVGSVVDLVFLEATLVHLRVYQVEGNAAASEAGSVDEFRLEVCAADDAAEFDGDGAVAVPGSGLGAVGVLLGDTGVGLCCDGPDWDAQWAHWTEELPICGVTVGGMSYGCRATRSQVSKARPGAPGVCGGIRMETQVLRLPTPAMKTYRWGPRMRCAARRMTGLLGRAADEFCVFYTCRADCCRGTGCGAVEEYRALRAGVDGCVFGAGAAVSGS